MEDQSKEQLVPYMAAYEFSTSLKELEMCAGIRSKMVYLSNGVSFTREGMDKVIADCQSIVNDLKEIRNTPYANVDVAMEDKKTNDGTQHLSITDCNVYDVAFSLESCGTYSGRDNLLVRVYRGMDNATGRIDVDVTKEEAKTMLRALEKAKMNDFVLHGDTQAGTEYFNRITKIEEQIMNAFGWKPGYKTVSTIKFEQL